MFAFMIWFSDAAELREVTRAPLDSFAAAGCFDAAIDTCGMYGVLRGILESWGARLIKD
jgi:hypothetical protein